MPPTTAQSLGALLESAGGFVDKELQSSHFVSKNSESVSHLVSVHWHFHWQYLPPQFGTQSPAHC